MDNIKRIDFKGIVRATSPQNNADGNCEEIINLRQDTGVWRAVGRKRAIIENVDYEQVYIHKYGTFENYIGIKEGKAVWFASVENGKIVSKDQEICHVSGEATLNQMNNILLVKDDNEIHKAIFQGNQYVVDVVELPELSSLEIVCYEKKINLKAYQSISFKAGDSTEEKAAKEAIFAIITKEISNEQYYTEGRVFISMAYELFDGSITKISQPMMIELGGYQNDVLEYANREGGGAVGATQRMDVRTKNLMLASLNIKINSTIPDTFKDLIARIHVYASPVISFYDPDTVNLNIGGVSRSVHVSEKKIEKKDIEKLLFYKVISVNANETKDSLVKVDLSSEVLTSNETLPVDASGWWNTTGDMFVYNNRLHLYNMRRTFIMDSNLKYYSEGQYKLGSALFSPGTEPETHDKYDFSNARLLTAITYIKTENADIRTKHDFRVELISGTVDGDNTIYKIRFPKFYAFPDSRAYKVDFFDGHFFIKGVRLSTSNTYNYAFYKFEEKAYRYTAFQGEDEYLLEYSSANIKELPAESPIFHDNMSIIASEATNPYYFPPEHSYLMPGEILNLAVNTEQISSSQVGMYPLYVFTTEGVYALQVGDGKILYSNVIPVSSEVAVKGSKVLQTKYGIVFVTESGLKFISGQEVADLSKPLEGKPDTGLRHTTVFPLMAQHPKLYDCSPFFSTVLFREYVREAVMGYDISKDEIIVSNPAYAYSYVYSLETKTWHKITEVFSGFNRHLGLKPFEGGNTVCDIRAEESGILPVYLQTRPLSMETFDFKKISRIMLRGELYPILNKCYSTVVFSSDDLSVWTAVADSHIPVHTPHALMGRTGFSFRYFVLATGGEVESDHVIALAEIEGEDKWDNRLR